MILFILIARSWLHGRRYEADEFRNRYARSSSVAPAEATSGRTGGGSWHADVVARAARSASEMRTAATSSSSAATARASMQRETATASTARASMQRETATEASSKQKTISSSMSSTEQTATTKKVASSQLSVSSQINRYLVV